MLTTKKPFVVNLRQTSKAKSFRNHYLIMIEFISAIPSNLLLNQLTIVASRRKNICIQQIIAFPPFVLHKLWEMDSDSRTL